MGTKAMKSDSVQFNTRMTLQQIVQVLNSYKCQIQSIQSDPFAQDKADIEVVMVGMATMADAAMHVGAGKSQWGVQVYVYDMGKYRSVELVALGESGFKYAWTEGRYQGALDSMVNGQSYINIRHSKKYRDEIMRKLQPVTSGGSRGVSDVLKSRLYKAIDQQPAVESRDLTDRIFTQMELTMRRFLDSHPDFSEQGLMTVPNEELDAYVSELMQIADDDAIYGNDRTALYTLIYVLSIIEKDRNNERFLSYNLLDRVLQLENSGADITEDLKIWPLFARYFDFVNWHEMKYGENGTSGKLKADDPALMGIKQETVKQEAASSRKTAGSGSKTGAAAVTAKAGAAAATVSSAAATANRSISSGAEAVRSEKTTTSAASGKSVSMKHASGGRSGISFNRKYLALAAAFLAVIILTAVIVNMIDKSKYENQTADSDNIEYSESSKGSVFDEDLTEITVLSSDWDWDSSREDENGYVVDAILLVKNDSGTPITGINFHVDSDKGEKIVNERNPEGAMAAYGYVENGSTGIMVGEVCTKVHTTRPDDSTYDITGAYSNSGISDYTVPSGYVTRSYGEGNNDYDVSIDNPNSVPVSQSAKLVMVKIDNNKIKDSDATGRLTSSINPGTTGCIQEKAFYDPHMYVSYKQLKVYAIDTDYYDIAN